MCLTFIVSETSEEVVPCVREDCTRPRAKNPRTGDIHNHCSIRCMRLDQLEKKARKLQLGKETGILPKKA